MKLWSCNGVADGWDAHRLMVGETREEVITRWEIDCEDELIYHLSVTEIEEVEGYKIQLVK